MYLTCEPQDSVGVQDIATLRTRLIESCSDTPSQWDDNLKRAERYVYSILYARLTLLLHAVDQKWEPHYWLWFQVGTIFAGQKVSPDGIVVDMSVPSISWSRSRLIIFG
jgi:hypothetical protein